MLYCTLTPDTARVTIWVIGVIGVIDLSPLDYPSRIGRFKLLILFKSKTMHLSCGLIGFWILKLQVSKPQSLHSKA